ncbi:MAG: helix-turn-helix domain-containing protein [Verrucomicrobiae bacterium]|nr:helix-turn-helix domain-containing protein [Verrucomicrobiae bacterium]
MNTLRQDRSEFNVLFVHSQLDDLGLDVYEFRIYAHLARRANGKTKAWPGITSMSRACRMKRHTVIRAIHQLEERGLIRVVRKPGGLSEYLLTAPSEWKPETPTSAVMDTGASNGTGALPGTGAVSERARPPVPFEALKGNPREGNPEKVLNTVGRGSRGPTASPARRVGDGGRPASGPSAMNGKARSPSVPRQESRKTDRSQTSLRRKAFAVASRLESLHWDNCKVAYALHAARSYAEQAMEDGHDESTILDAYRQALQYTHGVATDAMDRGERSRHELANPALTIYLARCALAKDGKTVEQRREETRTRLREKRRKAVAEDQRLHEEALRLAPEVAAWFAERSREATPQGSPPSVIGPTTAASQATSTGVST